MRGRRKPQTQRPSRVWDPTVTGPARWASRDLSASALIKAGDYSLSIEDYGAAGVAYQLALEADVTSAAARDRLDNLKCAIVSAWHFRMLNDERRNLSFYDAIEEVFRRRKDINRVLDVGTGSGLLACQAAEIAQGLGMKKCVLHTYNSRTMQHGS